MTSDRAFRDILDLFMMADPWDYGDELRERIRKRLEYEAMSRGYADWVDAYHHFVPANE